VEAIWVRSSAAWQHPVTATPCAECHAMLRCTPQAGRIISSQDGSQPYIHVVNDVCNSIACPLVTLFVVCWMLALWSQLIASSGPFKASCFQLSLTDLVPLDGVTKLHPPVLHLVPPLPVNVWAGSNL
jgi:hypothetical protein